MKDYNNITFFENQARRNELSNFRKIINKYFNSLAASDYDYKPHETKDSKKIRETINKILHKNRKILLSARIDPVLIYKAPMYVGGTKYNVDVFNNMFHLHQYDISEQFLFDLIDQAIGIYEEDFIKSIIRTFNPFYWFGQILELVSKAPFYLLNKIGVPTHSFENSLAGSIFKSLIKVITLFSTVWQTLIFLGLIPAEFTLNDLFK